MVSEWFIIIEYGAAAITSLLFFFFFTQLKTLNPPQQTHMAKFKIKSDLLEKSGNYEAVHQDFWSSPKPKVKAQAISTAASEIYIIYVVHIN